MTHDNQHTEHESENARLRREHAAMLAFIKMAANVTAGSRMENKLPYEARDLLSAITDTPDTPPAGVAGSGATPLFTQQIIEKIEQRAIQRNSMYQVHEYVTWDDVAVFIVGFEMRHLLHAPLYLYLSEKGWVSDEKEATHYETEDEAELAANILNSTRNAAPPASGNADTVRYTVQRKGIEYRVIDNRSVHGAVIFRNNNKDVTQAECDRLNAADTVAGSNAGGTE